MIIKRIIKKISQMLVLALCCWGIVVFATACDAGEIYQTTDIKDYGNFIGTYDDETLKKTILAYFPDEIQDNFEIIKYSYKAIKGDSISCEAYLEFSIDDEEEFDSYVSQMTNETDTTVFEYDSSFREYVKQDYLLFSFADKHNIESADIRKVLYSDETNTMIFVYIVVYDGGYTRSDSYNEYFSRFGIDMYSVEHYDYIS